jgi:hypothetical protein
MWARLSRGAAWAGIILAAAILAGCSERVDPERATSVKLGSPRASVQRQIGTSNFDFHVMVGSDQYLGESRWVGYAGQYLFVYRNGRFIKICKMPPMDLRYRPNWEYLAARVKLVVDEPRVTEIPYVKAPPPDPDEEQFF